MIKREDGFTLVEIGVVVPIIMVIAIGLFAFMFSYLLSSNREQTRLNQLYAQSDALGRIEADIRLTNGFLATNDTATPDTYDKYSSGKAAWSYAGAGTSGPQVLIVREYSTTGNPLASTRAPVYQKIDSSTDCSTITNIGQPLTYDIVYFVANATLYRRVLTNPSPTTNFCSTPYQQTSCPSLTTLAPSSRNASCQADDEVLAKGVSNFMVSYYDSGNSTTALNAYTDQTLLSTALSVNVTIVSTGRTYGEPVTTNMSLRMTTKNDQNGAAS
jgi:type II secretory pathway pseudopilin PulG